jgi:Tfp pilus assembly protein PilN
MNQVNLLPPEILQRERARRLTGLVALVGAVVVLLILAVWVLETLALSDTNDQLAAQEATNAALQSQVQGLQRYADTQAELATKQALVAKVFKNEVAWSGVLGDLSNVVPADAYLQNFTFQEDLASSTSGGAATAGTETTAPGVIGSLSFTAQAQEATTVSEMLARMAQVNGWEEPDATGISETQPRSRIYDFSMTTDLTQDALTPRGAGEESQT